MESLTIDPLWTETGREDAGIATGRLGNKEMQPPAWHPGKLFICWHELKQGRPWGTM